MQSRKLDGYAMKYTNEAQNIQTCTITNISALSYLFNSRDNLNINFSPSYR